MWTIKVAQRLLRVANYYKGEIDGKAGPKTYTAVAVIGKNRGGWPDNWSPQRKLVAASQAVLEALGHEPGPVDGLLGHNTHEACRSYMVTVTGKPDTFIRPTHTSGATATQAKWPVENYANLRRFYGEPGTHDCTAGSVVLPFEFPLAWDMDKKIKRFSCHKRVAENFTTIFAEAAEHYGERDFRRLGLDLYGGCYMYRNMRGGSELSMHSWGIAVDIDPVHNKLRWGRRYARLARPEYDAWWKIVTKQGATSLGLAADFDWMHIQFARRRG